MANEITFSRRVLRTETAKTLNGDMIYAIIILISFLSGGVSMQLQCSYIFLPNPYHEKPAHRENKENVIYFELGHSLPRYISEAFPNIKVDRQDELFFQENYSLTINNSINVLIIAKNVGESYYVNVIAEGKKKAEIIESLEYVQSALFATKVEDDYIPIVSYDSVSEYYCNRLYPKLNKIERYLRNLMLNIYVLNFGKEYYKSLPEEVQNKAKDRARARSGKKAKEIHYLKEIFYALEYSDIKEILFSYQWKETDREAQLAFLSGHEYLSKLSDKEIRDVIKNTSPKSDWDRLFADKFQGVSIEKDIEIIRKARNNVAHCRFLEKDEFDKCDKIVDDLNKAIRKAIKITENKDFINKNAENLREAMLGLSSRIHEITERLQERFLLSAEKVSGLSETTSLLISENIKNVLDISLQSVRSVFLFDADENRVTGNTKEDKENESSEDA